MTLQAHKLLGLAFLLKATLSFAATTYFVDFDSGNDSNDARAAGTPWKHCPGDPSASGKAASTALAPGDTVVFKGGVRYKGTISVNASGASGKPITFTGNRGFGSGKAILDGTVEFKNTWIRCKSQEEAYGNPNFLNIWYAPIAFADQTAMNTVIVDNVMLPFAQDRNPTAPILWDVVSNWRSVPDGQVSASTVTDPGMFNQSDSSFWTGVWMGRHMAGNSLQLQLIKGFKPATNTVTTDSFGSSTYNPSPYAVLGHPLHIDSKGEYAVIAGKMFIWPPNGGDPNLLTVRVAQLNHAIVIPQRNHITVDGFVIEGYYGDLDDGYYEGFAVGNNGSSTYVGLNYINNDARFIRSLTGGPVFALNRASNSSIVGNTIIHCVRSRGVIIGTCDNIVVRGNSLNGVGGTGIYFAGVRNSEISYNSIMNVRGVHGNGISVYQGSDNILVNGNRLMECGSPITFEVSSNLTFANNFVDCAYGVVNEWGGCTGPVYWFNNTIVNHNRHSSLNIGRSPVQYVIRNNILDGMTWGNDKNITRSNNIYTGTPVGYAAPPMKDGEVVVTNLNAIFVNAATGDYRLKASSPAIGAAISLMQNVSVDLNGLSRGSVWDIGAFQYSLSASPDVTLNAPTNLEVRPQVYP